MKLIKTIKNKFELKKLKKEQIWLDCYLEKNSKKLKFLKDEEIKEYQKFYTRYYDVIDRIDELEEINKRSWFKRFFGLIRRRIHDIFKFN